MNEMLNRNFMRTLNYSSHRQKPVSSSLVFLDSGLRRNDKFREPLIHSANEVKHEAHGTQQPRHIDKIGEGASTAQRSDSLVQPINQRSLGID